MAIVTTRRRSMSPARRHRIFEAHAGVCGWCHEAIEDGEAYEIDHAVPLWFGGADDDGPNAYPIHEGCHKRKTYGVQAGHRAARGRFLHCQDEAPARPAPRPRTGTSDPV